MLSQWFNTLMHDEPQKLRLRRMSISLVGGVILTGICVIYYHLGVFRTNSTQFLYLMSGFWVINSLFVLCVVSGLNKKLKDPSLTFLQMFWSITAIMIAAYFFDERRSVLLMMCLLVFSFGGLYLRPLKFTLFVSYSIFLYILVLFLIKNTPSLVIDIDVQHESTAIFVYSLVAFSYCMFAFELGGLRRHMHSKTGTLSNSLQEAKDELLIDPLTGVGNRRYLIYQLEQQSLIASRKKDYYFCCIFIDLDHFKHVNDTYGHLVGDKLLIAFCQVIQSLIRKTEFFGRFGGEEFLLLSSMTDIEEAFTMAQRICKTVAETDFSDATPHLKITVSIGLTQFKSTESIETFLNRVDKAMYKAKKGGRNKVVVL